MRGKDTSSHEDRRPLLAASQAMELVSPAYGGSSWEDAIESLLADPIEAQVVADLVGELAVNGEFERPIVWEVDPETGDRVVSDGMHRLVAAHRAGAPVVLVEGYPEDTLDEFVRVDLRVRVASGLPIDEELWCQLVSVLRSFRIEDGPWVTSDVFSGCSDQLSGTWICAHRNADGLVEAILRRARSYEKAIHLAVAEVACERSADWSECSTDCAVSAQAT